MKIKLSNYWKQKRPLVFTLFGFYCYGDMFGITLLNFSLQFYTKKGEWLLKI